MFSFKRADHPYSIHITPYERRSRQDVRDMLFRSYRSHTHLDWQESDQWLDAERSPVKLAWIGRRLVGILGVSEPMEGECWVRIAAAQDEGDPQPILDALWNAIYTDLLANKVKRVAILMMREWLFTPFKLLNFREHEWIVTLRRLSSDIPAPQTPPGVAIRPAEPNDIDRVLAVDHAAFGALWRMTMSDLRSTMRAAASTTVAILNDTIIGYQLSTMYFDGSHLARLAVMPNLQTSGIGTALVIDVLRRFARRGIQSMTVNTQMSNERSQHVYHRLGFERNGYDIPVWIMDLNSTRSNN